MCDTLCAIGGGGTRFAKSSDRPPHEAQVVEAHPRRPPGGRLRTQYLELDDTGAHAVLGSRPHWLWGFEHGVNEHRVAIGNEKVWTVADASPGPPSLIGMDLVRLGLERATTSAAAIEVMTALLEGHGQGGPCQELTDESYSSAFLVADPREAWVLETAGRTWAARRFEDGGVAISNRIRLRDDWTLASADVPPGADFQAWRDPDAPTATADRRLAVTESCVAGDPGAVTPEHLVATLRDHGTGPWGAPGADPGVVAPPPPTVEPDGTGITVCMHRRGEMVTTASMVCDLPADPRRPMRVWMLLGSPCVGLYVPVFAPHGVPTRLASIEVWRRFARLRDRVETDGHRLGEIRERLAPLESRLWAAASAIAPTDDDRVAAFAADADRAIDAVLAELAG